MVPVQIRPHPYYRAPAPDVGTSASASHYDPSSYGYPYAPEQHTHLHSEHSPQGLVSNVQGMSTDKSAVSL